MKELAKCAKSPCSSCPYRTDVPSGIWSEDEYDKLSGYDGEIIDQLMAGATQLFDCHQKDGHLCAGWVATHDMEHMLATRLHQVDPMVFDYVSPVPVFSSGQAARDHGVKEIASPGEAAHKQMASILKKRAKAKK